MKPIDYGDVSDISEEMYVIFADMIKAFFVYVIRSFLGALLMTIASPETTCTSKIQNEDWNFSLKCCKMISMNERNFCELLSVDVMILFLFLNKDLNAYSRISSHTDYKKKTMHCSFLKNLLKCKLNIES